MLCFSLFVFLFAYNYINKVYYAYYNYMLNYTKCYYPNAKYLQNDIYLAKNATFLKKVSEI